MGKAPRGFFVDGFSTRIAREGKAVFAMSGKAFPQCLPSPAPRGIRPRRFPPSPLPFRPPGASGEQGMRKSRGFPPGPQWGRNVVLLLGCVGRVAGRPKPISRKAIGLNGRGGAHGRRRMADSPSYAGHASRIGLNGRGKRAAMAFPSAPAAAGRAIRPLFPFRTRGPAVCCRPKPSSFPRSRP